MKEEIERHERLANESKELASQLKRIKAIKWLETSIIRLCAIGFIYLLLSFCSLTWNALCWNLFSRIILAFFAFIIILSMYLNAHKK